MNEETLKQNIVQELDRLSPKKLEEVRDFIESLRRSQSTSSLFEKIDESIRSISDDEWAEVPTDASKRLDDYLYGPSDAWACLSTLNHGKERRRPKRVRELQAGGSGVANYNPRCWF